MTMARHTLVLCSVLLLSGCITTPASETGWSAKVRHAKPILCGEQAQIDDFEDGDTQTLKRDGRGGYFYGMLDAHGSSVTPQPFKPSAPGRAGSKYAARMSGQLAPGAPGVYPYAGFGFGLSEHGTYDATRYQGVSFWAKGPGKIRLEVPDAYTSPAGGWCSDCYNDFGREIALTDQWQQYTVLWEWLLQKPNWGDRKPQITPARLVALEWEFSSHDRAFDIQVDDVAFVCGVEGESP
jgi:endoglucanase